MSWWQDKLHQLSSDSYLTRNKSHSTHSRDATRRIPPLIQRVHHFPPDLRVKEPRQWVLASSVLYVSQFSLSAMSNSLWPHGLQHTRLPWPSPTTGAYSNSCPLGQWCHPAISSSVIPFSCLQSFPVSEFFQMSQFFASGVQSIGVSASALVLPVNIQDRFPLGLIGWISLQSKGLSRVFSNTTVQKHQFFSTQLSL